jgi:transposase
MAQVAGNLHKFTEETTKKLLLSIRTGNYVEVACAAAGISRPTLLRWLRWSKRKKLPEAAEPLRERLKEFAADYHRAEAEAEEDDVMRLRLAGRRDWRAIAFRLERKHPERWGRKDRVEHVGEGGKPITFQREPADMTSEEIKRRVEELEAKALTLAGAAAPGRDEGDVTTPASEPHDDGDSDDET